MERRILVRADDFGYSEAVNYGLAKSVKEGIIRSVGVMTNMPVAKHGLSLLEGIEVCYGLHTNICVGRPLTDPLRIPSLVGEDGCFKSSKEYRSAKEDFVVLDEVILEIEAQYQRFVKLIGEKPHYFEGHAVMSDNFFKGMEIVAQKYGCEYLPCPFISPIKFRNTMMYVFMESEKPDYDPFEALKRACEFDYGTEGCAMFICHPGYLDQYILKNSSMTIPRTQEVEMACADKTKEWLEKKGIRIVTYDDIL